jgi:hypothetical protein
MTACKSEEADLYEGHVMKSSNEKSKPRYLLYAFIGFLLGFFLPNALAALNVLPFLRNDTSYETVLTYMVYSALVGASIGAVAAKHQS